MENPIRIYLDMLDGAAFDKAESGESIGREAPMLPFWGPILLGFGLFLLMPPDSIVGIVVLATALTTAIGCEIAAVRFYLKRVHVYREQLGTVREQPDRRITIAILGAGAVVLIYGFWQAFSQPS